MMFNEVPFLERFQAASGAGFTAVEFLFPYEYTPEEVASTAKAAGTEVVLFNMPAGNWGCGRARNYGTCRDAKRSFARALRRRSFMRGLWACRGFMRWPALLPLDPTQPHAAPR